jgi:hypothetical protein
LRFLNLFDTGNLTGESNMTEKIEQKIESFWQDATAKDVERVMAGETVEARFWDDEHRGKVLGSLVGWSRSEPCWCCEHCKQTGGRSYFENCQVYREPSWYANKPDPGPGFRLLEKFPDEPVAVGDEFFKSGKWYETFRPAGDSQDRTGWYRRRIEPVAKFAVGQTVRVVGPKEKPAKDWGKEMDRQIGFAGVIRSIPLIEGEGTFYNLEGIGIWCFREDYLEPVEPVESKPVLIRRRAVEIGDEIELPNGRVLIFNGEGFEVTQ